MTNDSFFALTCAATIGLMYGSILAFAGYRFFLFLLPIWGFFFGFGLGAQSIQTLTNSGFLADITSWVVGFFLGLLFAALSYLFFAAAVGFAVGSLGYTMGAGLMLAIGFDMGFLTWIVGVAVAVLFVIGVFYLKLWKWAIIIATSIMGAGVIVGTMLFLLGKLPPAQLVANPVQVALNDSPFWVLLLIAIAVLGLLAQYQTTRSTTVVEYNHWEEMTSEQPAETLVPAGTTAAGMAPAMATAAPAGGTAPPPPPAPPADVPPPADTSSEPPPSGSA